VQLFLDSANPKIWERMHSIGVFRGVTTNPTLLKKASQECSTKNIRKLLDELKKFDYQELHLQAWGETSQDLYETGLELNELNESNIRILIKVPITEEGCKAAKKLIKEKVKITLTACYEAKQVIIAAALGAEYIAPYLGRMDDAGKNGIEEIIKMQVILNASKSSCKILAASIRNADQIRLLSSHKINNFSLNENVWEDLINSNLTYKSAIDFNKDSKIKF
tara:strand:- start:5633 stop:6298 length:666 start_codon:yes stop_codon:yes gene_type:complete